MRRKSKNIHRGVGVKKFLPGLFSRHDQSLRQAFGAKGGTNPLFRRTFADDEPICVILGDNTTDADIRPAVENFTGGATIFLKEVPDPHRFGCPVFAGDDPARVVEIQEKPRNPRSPYAVTGLYIYDPHVFDHIAGLEPSERGEFEITDVNNCYLREGQLHWHELDGFWSDAGTFESLYRTTRYWAEKKLGKHTADRVAAGLFASTP